MKWVLPLDLGSKILCVWSECQNSLLTPILNKAIAAIRIIIPLKRSAVTKLLRVTRIFQSNS